MPHGLSVSLLGLGAVLTSVSAAAGAIVAALAVAFELLIMWRLGDGG